MAKTLVVIIKFRAKTSESVRTEHLRAVIGNDLVRLEPVFPDSDEPDLETLVAAHVRGKAKLPQILAELEKDETVEYAHEPPERTQYDT
jgi:hypothetical protein